LASFDDADRFVTTVKDGSTKLDLDRKHFVSGNITYRYQKTDHPIVPVKGFRFSSSAAYIYNFNKPIILLQNSGSDAAVYIPYIGLFHLLFVRVVLLTSVMQNFIN
jgi:hypothetical protein